MPSDMKEKALEMFALMVLLEEDNLDHPRCHYLARVANQTLPLPDELRIEVFLQVIRQMTGEKHALYVRLFCILCATVTIPEKMHKPLLNYMLASY